MAPTRPHPLVRLAFVAAVAALLLLAVPGVHAASPSPGVVGPGDTRSEGEGAGLVGSPVLVALGVVGLGIAAAGATLLYLRLTRDD